MRRLWPWVAGAIGLVLVVTLAISWPHVQRFTTGLPPEQFHEELDPALLQDYPAVLGIAHNAGNRLDTVQLALAHGADVIEVDVISVRGQIVAGRDQPWPWLGEHLFRGPTLESVWEHAAAAQVLKLDLKQTDRAFLDDLVAFLAPRASSREVMISTRNEGALLYLHQRLPAVTMLYSIGFPEGFQHLRADAVLQHAIGGATVFQGLVSSDLVTWMHERHLLVLAWTVNDVHRLNELVALHVDGVTTANLAILQALS
ncbi:MAG TPA: glycerophosphodiester phosphodiesterase [Actinomycetes bacterium]|nr:glycerophosphodiester phosphodiesterase [Actinomycetes bacterium]